MTKDKIIGEVEFNWENDKKEFGAGDRIVRLCRFMDGCESSIGLSFELGRKPDDTISVTFDFSELVAKLLEAEVD